MSFDTYIGVVFTIVITVGVALIPLLCGIKFFKNNRTKKQNRKSEFSRSNIIIFKEKSNSFHESKDKMTSKHKIIIFLALFGILLIIIITVIYVFTKSSNNTENINPKIKNDDLFKEDDFDVIVTYNTDITQKSISGIDVLIRAETSFPAEYVILSSTSNVDTPKQFNMHGGTYEWDFIANFYIKGTYTITIIAYASDGRMVTDMFDFTY